MFLNNVNQGLKELSLCLGVRGVKADTPKAASFNKSIDFDSSNS